MFKGKIRYPDSIPEELREEYVKYTRDKLKYKNLYPVMYKIIQSYLDNGESSNEETEESTSST